MWEPWEVFQQRSNRVILTFSTSLSSLVGSFCLCRGGDGGERCRLAAPEGGLQVTGIPASKLRNSPVFCLGRCTLSLRPPEQPRSFFIESWSPPTPHRGPADFTEEAAQAPGVRRPGQHRALPAARDSFPLRLVAPPRAPLGPAAPPGRAGLSS